MYSRCESAQPQPHLVLVVEPGCRARRDPSPGQISRCEQRPIGGHERGERAAIVHDRDEARRNRSAEQGSGDQVVVGTRQGEVGFTRSGPKDALRPTA